MNFFIVPNCDVRILSPFLHRCIHHKKKNGQKGTTTTNTFKDSNYCFLFCCVLIFARVFFRQKITRVETFLWANGGNVPILLEQYCMRMNDLKDFCYGYPNEALQMNYFVFSWISNTSINSPNLRQYNRMLFYVCALFRFCAEIITTMKKVLKKGNMATIWLHTDQNYM